MKKIKTLSTIEEIVDTFVFIASTSKTTNSSCTIIGKLRIPTSSGTCGLSIRKDCFKKHRRTTFRTFGRQIDHAQQPFVSSYEMNRKNFQKIPNKKSIIPHVSFLQKPKWDLKEQFLKEKLFFRFFLVTTDDGKKPCSGFVVWVVEENCWDCSEVFSGEIYVGMENKKKRALYANSCYQQLFW